MIFFKQAGNPGFVVLISPHFYRGTVIYNTVNACFMHTSFQIVKAEILKDKLEIQILKSYNLKIFSLLADTFFRTLWGPKKTSLCSRCASWATGLQFLLEYSYWDNSVYITWFLMI